MKHPRCFMYDRIVNQEADIFSKVSDTEKARLFKDAANSRTEILCKGESDQIYHFLAERTTPRQELICSIPFGIPQPKNEKEMIANFFLGGERYFFRSHATVVDPHVHLSTAGELFHLQRRQNYRIKIPESYVSHFLITEHRNSPVKIKAAIYDLSVGGSRVILQASEPALAIGDQITGQIIMTNREPLEVDGIIRHHKLEGAVGKNARQTFGIEFQALSALLEGKLFAITMELHRELFSRLNTKL